MSHKQILKHILHNEVTAILVQKLTLYPSITQVTEQMYIFQKTGISELCISCKALWMTT
jgi:hypothetical protein